METDNVSTEVNANTDWTKMVAEMTLCKRDSLTDKLLHQYVKFTVFSMFSIIIISVLQNVPDVTPNSAGKEKEN